MKSLECLTKECVFLLQEHNLLRKLIRELLIKESLAEVSIDNSLKDKEISAYKKKIGGLETKEDFDNFLQVNYLTYENFVDLALKYRKIEKYSFENFGNQVEAHFLKRKSQLDIIVYSLIRTKDFYKAQELYLRIIEKEADFNDLASQFSEGLEKKSRGIVGPLPLENAHPSLANHLKSSKCGETQPPIAVLDSWVIVRVESYESSSLDEFMRQKMAEELFTKKIEDSIHKIQKELIKSLEPKYEVGGKV